jgi:hypothetical protein
MPGVLMAPLASTTCSARMMERSPPLVTSTPMVRCPSNTTRTTCVCAFMRNPGRARTLAVR